jgi:kynurenine formamidase
MPQDKWHPSRWGKEDQVGALNLITADSVFSALRLVRKGKVFDLSHFLEEGMPLNWFHSDFLYSTFRDISHARSLIDKLSPNKNKASYMNLRMDTSDHAGTHIDALNHAAIDGLFYNGNDYRKISTVRGTTRLGIETMPPLISRGVLVDITLIKKKGERYVITPQDLKIVLRKEHVAFGLGDTLLIYTGWEKLWKKDNATFVSRMPGIGVRAANWIAKIGAVAVGSDTQSVEVVPNENPAQEGIVHQILLAKNGIHLIENMVLSELSSAKVYEFLFICLPLKIRGGTGSPVAPVAIA